MLRTYDRRPQGRTKAFLILGGVCLVAQVCVICLCLSTQALGAQTMNPLVSRPLQHEVVRPLDIAIIQTSTERKPTEEVATTLYDLYLDEERPFLIGEASKLINESVALLGEYQNAKLLVETYCDQRNTSAYGMAIGHQRTWQVQDYITYLEIPSSRVLAVSYGTEGFQCRESSAACWEEHIRVQSAFKYLAISQPKLGCLVRFAVEGIDKGRLNMPSSHQSQFLQKIKLAPVHHRRRLRRYVYRSPKTSLPPSYQKSAVQ